MVHALWASILVYYLGVAKPLPERRVEVGHGQRLFLSQDSHACAFASYALEMLY
jgi:hypothetical protein